MITTKDKFQKAQSPYKKNYDAHFRKQSKAILEDYYVYLIVEITNPKDHSY